jgi:predicted transcriptional regulator
MATKKGHYTRHQLVLKLPSELKARLAQAKRRTKTSYNQITQQALLVWLKKEEARHG